MKKRLIATAVGVAVEVPARPVGVGVGVRVARRVGVRVGVIVAVGVRVARRVGVAVAVGVRVGRRVGVRVGVAVEAWSTGCFEPEWLNACAGRIRVAANVISANSKGNSLRGRMPRLVSLDVDDDGHRPVVKSPGRPKDEENNLPCAGPQR